MCLSCIFCKQACLFFNGLLFVLVLIFSLPLKAMEFIGQAATSYTLIGTIIRFGLTFEGNVGHLSLLEITRLFMTFANVVKILSHGWFVGYFDCGLCEGLGTTNIIYFRYV